MAASKKKILLVDDEADFVWLTSRMLEDACYHILEASNGEDALKRFKKDIPDLVLMDYRMPDKDGLETSLQMKQIHPEIPIVIITGYAEIRIAVNAMKAGIYDYVTKPLNPDDFLFTIQRALEKMTLEKEVQHLKHILDDRAPLHERMGPSHAIQNLVQHVEKVAPTTFTVLIEGESGTGKELVAGAIHDLSLVKDGPFVAVDCGAIPETLIESELFGYRKGAFTGAHTDKMGHFQMADGGTLFLDEVGNLSYPVQQKLLRAIQERKIQRLGGGKPESISTRIVAATNQSLEKDVKSGLFRSDLYFRLNEFTIKLPPLRERKDDIPYLAVKFQNEVEKELNKKCGGLSSRALGRLSSYSWPGNVRELRSTIRQSVLLCEENMSITPKHLAFSSHHSTGNPQKAEKKPMDFYDGSEALKETINRIRNEVEKKAVQETLILTKGNKSETARRLSIDYKTLLRKIKKYQIAPMQKTA
jgi:DNA-binding NtrC family response regulator